MKNIQAFEAFYKEYYARFFYQAHVVIEDREVCRDILEDCFERIWLNHSSSDARQWGAYMYTLLRSRCIDYLRKQQAKMRYSEYYLHFASEIPEDMEAEAERDATIHEIISSLPEQTRRILEACYVEKKKYREVAEGMGISTNTVKKHIMAALKIFREKMKKQPQK